VRYRVETTAERLVCGQEAVRCSVTLELHGFWFCAS